MRKGQAAMEFLMTYGWAILVVLAAIGALAYFGVLSPDRFLPDKCTATPPFSCTQFKVQNNNVILTVQNSAGVDMSSVQIYLTGNDGANCWPLVSGTPDAVAAVANGDAKTVTYTIACPATTGLRWKGNFSINYTKTGESLSHLTTGSIQARAE